MRRLILILCLTAIVTGCRSHKEAAAVSSALMNDTVSVSQVKKTQSDTEIILGTALTADSVNIRFTADSIRVGDKVIYGPHLSSVMHNPSNRISAVSSGSIHDSTDTNLTASRHASSESREHTARDIHLKSPVNFGIFIGLAAILIIGVVMILRHYVRLSH